MIVGQVECATKFQATNSTLQVWLKRNDAALTDDGKETRLVDVMPP